MKAVVAYGPKDYRLEEVDVPVIENDKEIIVKVEATGICAGDIKAFDGAPSFGAMTHNLLILKPL